MGACEVARRPRTQPRREEVTGLELGPRRAHSVSVPVCSTLTSTERTELETVSSGRKPQFPPRGTDKDLIKTLAGVLAGSPGRPFSDPWGEATEPDSPLPDRSPLPASLWRPQA